MMKDLNETITLLLLKYIANCECTCSLLSLMYGYVSVKVIKIDQHLTELHSHPSVYHNHGVVFFSLLVMIMHIKLLSC